MKFLQIVWTMKFQHARIITLSAIKGEKCVAVTLIANKRNKIKRAFGCQREKENTSLFKLMYTLDKTLYPYISSTLKTFPTLCLLFYPLLVYVTVATFAYH